MPMTIRKAFRDGIRQTNRSFLAVLLLYGVNFLFAGIAAMIFQSVLSTTFGNSIAPIKFVQDFDFTVYIDFTTKNPGKLSPVYALIPWFIIVNNLFSVFFDGGVIASVQSKTERFRFQSFCASCGEFAGRFLRLFIIVVPAMLITGFVMILLSGFVSSAVVGSGETEIQLLRGVAVAVVIFLLPLSILFLAADYARVITVVENERRMFRAFWHGIQFVMRKLFKAYTLFILCLFLSLLLLGCWAAVSTQVAVHSGFMVLGIFLIQQIIAAGRSWVRVVSIGSQVALYNSSQSVAQAELPFVPEKVIDKEMMPQQIPASAEANEEVTARVLKTRVKPRVAKKRIDSKRTKRTKRTKQTVKRAPKQAKK
jgi:hypothetical protein